MLSGLASAPSAIDKPIAMNWGTAPAGWDAQLANYPQATIFHTTAWAKVLNQAYGYKPLYLTQPSAEGLPAHWVLLEVNSPLTGRRAISLPFTDFCEPLGANRESMRALLDQAIALGKERRWKYLELRGGRTWLPEAAPSLQFYGHIIDLSAPEETLFANLHNSVRQAIRKAEKAGVSVDVSTTLEAVNTYYQLHGKTRKKHGLPPQPFAFFNAIYEQIIAPGQGAVVIAKHENIPIAAAIHFYYGREAVYKFGASDEQFQQYRGNNLAMWEAMKWLRRQGAQRLHLGRSSLVGDGLRRYKLNLGATEHAIEYLKYDLRQNCFVTETDSAHGWHTRIFRWMPAPLARWIGTLLYPHIA